MRDFLAATHRIAPPRYWDDPNFQDRRAARGRPFVVRQRRTYCEWLGAATCAYRLPTEAEWEWAAHGGNQNALYSLGRRAARVACQTMLFAGRPARNRWHGYAPNVFGLFNMGDNVHEWCADWYDARYYETSPERNPRGPDRQLAAPRAAAPGATRSRFPAAPRDPASLRISITPITDFAWCVPARKFEVYLAICSATCLVTR